MNVCDNCGAQLKSGERYCKECGTSIASVGGTGSRKFTKKGLFITLGLVVIVFVSIFAFKGLIGIDPNNGSAGISSFLGTDESVKAATFKDGKTTILERAVENEIVEGDYAVEKDGWIYYGGNNGSFEKMNNDGSGRIELMRSFSDDGYYKFDPDQGFIDGHYNFDPDHIVIVGDWIYVDFGSGIWRIRTDFADVGQLTYDYCSDFTVVGDWIYFTDDDRHICKVKTDGSEYIVLTDDQCGDSLIANRGSGQIVVSNDWIYYYELQFRETEKSSHDVGINLYKIRTDGTGKTLLSNEETDSTYISVDNDWIYFNINNDDTSENYKMRLDGSGKTKYEYDNKIHGDVYKSWFYFENRDDERKLYRMRLDGSDKTKLSDSTIDHYEITNDWIYYQIQNENSLYKIKVDGTEKKHLVNLESNQGNSTWFVLVGDWIYFKDYDEDRNYLFSTDVTDRQILDPPN